MRWLRLSLPLLFAFALALTQQEGMVHILGHTLSQQQEKHSSDTPACEKCQHYAQLGNALHAAAPAFTALGTPGAAIHSPAPSCLPAPAAGAPARAPPTA